MCHTCGCATSLSAKRFAQETEEHWHACPLSWGRQHGLSPAQFNNHVAKVLVNLGDFAAACHFHRSLRLHVNKESMPRIYALTSTWLAEAQCRLGHVEQACQTWSGALDLIDGIQSSQTAEAKRSMNRELIVRLAGCDGGGPPGLWRHAYVSPTIRCSGQHMLS